MYRENDAKTYARLIACTGVNVQKGQRVYIRSSVENTEFTRLVAAACWEAGAGDVITEYSDEVASRMRYEHAAEDILTDIPKWMTEPRVYLAKKGACFISIVSGDPDNLNGLDSKKLGAFFSASAKAFSEFYEIINTNVNQWTVVAAPGKAWAKKLFPQLSDEAATEKLWDCIYHTVRIDDPDPVESWALHAKKLRENSRKLNELKIKSLHISNSLGTDLTVELVDGYIFEGGSSFTDDKNIEFEANMPTEEVFTMPHKYGVNGVVYSSMPLIYNGNSIDNFRLTFKDGRVVDFDAETGKAELASIFDIDEGASHLGEIALVPFKSMIRETGILFYNTLFDENASCHLALGSAYPSTMEGCVSMTDEEKDKAGCNQSNTHVDFMFGTADLSITGTRCDGTTIQVFENGNWSF